MIVNFIVCCWDLLFRRQPKYLFTRGELLKREACSALRCSVGVYRPGVFSFLTPHALGALQKPQQVLLALAPGPTRAHPHPLTPRGCPTALYRNPRCSPLLKVEVRVAGPPAQVLGLAASASCWSPNFAPRFCNLCILFFPPFRHRFPGIAPTRIPKPCPSRSLGDRDLPGCCRAAQLPSSAALEIQPRIFSQPCHPSGPRKEQAVGNQAKNTQVPETPCSASFRMAPASRAARPYGDSSKWNSSDCILQEKKTGCRSLQQ